MGVHPTAVVADGAELGADVEIGPYCVLGPRVRLGDRCHLHSHVVIDGDTSIGEDCEIFPFATLGTTPQDKKLKGAKERPGTLRIGKHNRIREQVTIHGGTEFGGGITQIGDNNMLLVGSHVGHDAWVGSHVVFTNGAMIAGHTRIEDRVILGAMVGIHQFAQVGELAMVGAGALVTNDAPPFSLVQGDRARLVGVNLIGLHRWKFTPEQTTNIKRIYRLLFWRAGTISQKIEELRNTPLGRHDTSRKIFEFIAGSRRGVCAPRGRRLKVEDGKELADASVS